MCKECGKPGEGHKPGDYEVWGDQYRLYTGLERGWIIVDDWSELQEEIKKLNGGRE